MTNGSFSEWIPKFIHYLSMRNYSGHTLSSYRRTLQDFSHYIWLIRHAQEDTQIQGTRREHLFSDAEVRVSSGDLTNYLSWISSQRAYHATTLNRMLSSLSSFYRFLIMQDILDANPVPRVERPRIKNKELRYLKHSQVIRLLRSIQDPRDRLIIRIIYATGVRVSELCSINVEDIDTDDHTIRIHGKGGKIRMVFVDEDTLDEIDLKIGNRLSGPLFIGQQGHHISPRTIQHIFRKYAPDGITPHKIRHSYASELYRRSKNLRVVQENLGHASIKTTEVYLHTDLDERRQVYQDYFPLAIRERKDIEREPHPPGI
ncbi:MAG TPA: site-specific tyrosine recombinase/integron integrase [Methanospirillum sp.]|nr:site-specific tyrosine recombinase/integron integrase [Methanospirillum sp.]